MAQWVTPTYESGRYTASGAMTWSVDSGDVLALSYRLVDTTLDLLFHLNATTVGGTPSTKLQITLPEGRSAASKIAVPFYYSDNGTPGIGTATVQSTGTVLELTLSAGGNWAASTNATAVRGQIRLEYAT